MQDVREVSTFSIVIEGEGRVPIRSRVQDRRGDVATWRLQWYFDRGACELKSSMPNASENSMTAFSRVCPADILHEEDCSRATVNAMSVAYDFEA